MQSIPLELGETITAYAEREELASREMITTVSEITPVQIRQFNSMEITDVFKSVPSVHIEGNDLSGRNIQIWGSNADEVNVYVDGILINMLGIKNQADISIVPLDKVAKINVHKGANLTLLGQGAFGGVVNIKTEDKQQSGITLRSKIGSYNSLHFNGQLNLALWDKIIMNYSGQYSELEPKIEYFPGERFTEKSTNDNINTKKQNHFFSLSYFTETGRLSTRIFNYDLHYTKTDWENKNDNYLFSLAFNGNLGHLKDFDIYVNHFYNDEEIKRTSIGDNQFISNFYSNRSNLKIAKKIEFNNKNSLQLLTEYFHDELYTDVKSDNANTKILLQKTDIYDNRMAAGGILSFEDQHEKFPFISWNTFFGFRGDFIASGEREFTKSIGAEVNVNMSDHNSSFFFNYGSNVKFPTLLEKAYIENYEIITTNRDTLMTRIKPEYINSFQLGLKDEYRIKNASIGSIESGVTYFHNTIYNKFLKQPYDTYIIQTQTGRNITQGLEASLRFNQIYRILDISTSYITMDISNKTLYAFKPDQKLTFQIDLFSDNNLSLSGRCFYEGKSYGWYYNIDNEIETEKMSPFYDFDVAINYELEIFRLKLEAQLTGSNILDSAEYSYYYLKKRYWQFSLSLGL